MTVVVPSLPEVLAEVCFDRAKFSATASLGVIYASRISEAIAFLEPYLPPLPEGNPVTATNRSMRLSAQSPARSHANKVISHGAALGVALTDCRRT